MSFCFLPDCLSWDMSSHLVWTSDKDLNHHSSSPAAFRLELNYTTDFSGSTDGSLGFHNIVRQFFIINISLSFLPLLLSFSSLSILNP